MKICAMIGVLTLVFAAAPGQAQDASDVTTQLLECREIDRDNSRLKCFDRVLEEAYGVDPEIEVRREASFGLPASDSRDEDQGITATISQVQIDQKFGTIVIALDNGQVWQATSNGNLRRGFDVGRTVTIRSGSFGGFRLYIEDRRGFRGVKRIR